MIKDTPDRDTPPLCCERRSKIELVTVKQEKKSKINNTNTIYDKLPAQNFLEQIINAMSDGVMVIDKKFTIKEVNRRFLQTYNFKRDEIIGQKCYDVNHKMNNPCCESKHHCPLNEVFKTGKRTNIESKY